MGVRTRRSLWGTRQSRRMYIILSAEDWEELESLASKGSRHLPQLIDDILHVRARDLYENRLRKELAEQVRAEMARAKEEANK